MSEIRIPAAALEAGAKALCNEQRLFWPDLTKDEHDIIRGEARAAFLAMVEAWPGAQRVKGYFTHDTDYYEPAFILPLEAPQGRIPPQEGGDE